MEFRRVLFRSLLLHAGLDRAEELLAVLAPLPHLAGEAPLARGDLAHVAIERGVVLRAVEQVRAAAGDFLVAVSGHTGERRVDRDESRSEEHTSELQSLMRISYAVFCLKKKQ